VRGHRFEILDLPGTYSLSSYSPEERIAQDELLGDIHDVIVVVADATLLRRSLVLLAQVMQTGNKLVLCLNMSDEAHEAGQKIDIEQMERLLGIPVVETVAHRGMGIRELLTAIQRTVDLPLPRRRVVLGGRLQDAIASIAKRLPGVSAEGGSEWLATRFLAGDQALLWDKLASGEEFAAGMHEAESCRRRIEAETGREISLYLMEQYFGFADGLLAEVTLTESRANARALSDAVDRVLVHRWLGLPLFAGVMYAIFWMTFSLGEAPMNLIEGGFEMLAGIVGGLWATGSESALRSLLVDGVIGGVGGVMVFLPNVLLLFLGLALLEDTGYMARAAFLMDRAMHRFGLHGKSFLPMITGFGCSIPGIMATRTLENERDRLTTMLVLPLMSCGARLPIWMLLVPAFFAPRWRAPALFSLYAVGLCVALLLALLLRKSLLRGADAPFVMELPPYRVPTLRGVATKIAERGWLYLRKAGTIILAISILMWVITAYPKKDEYLIDSEVAGGMVELTAEQAANARAAEDLRFSIAGRIGIALEPLIGPLGFDWKMGTAMVGAFAAKEVFVAQMGIVYSMGGVDEESAGLRHVLRRDYSQLSGISLMLFLLISTPCMATIAVTRRESGRWRWALLQLGGLTVIGYLVSLSVYRLGLFLA
jgi:ferrous iron transport protein B